MAKILEDGWNGRTWSARCRCDYCGALVEVGEDDLRLVPDGRACAVLRVGPWACPACNGGNNSLLDIPPVVMERLRRRYLDGA